MADIEDAGVNIGSKVTSLYNSAQRRINSLTKSTKSVDGIIANNISEPSLQYNSIWGNKSSDTNAILKVETINSIHGIPPIPDNIVDPPAIFNSSYFEDGRVTLNSWDTTVNKQGPFVGRDYLDRVVLRGSMLIMLPLELSTPLTAIQKSAIGSGSAENGYALGAATYGYEVKFNTTRYTESVLMHFFMAANAIGIDFSDDTIMAKAKRCLPNKIYQTISDNTMTSAALEGLLPKTSTEMGVIGSTIDSIAKGFGGVMDTLFGGGSSGDSESNIEQDAQSSQLAFDRLQSEIDAMTAQQEELMANNAGGSNKEAIASLEAKITAAETEQKGLIGSIISNNIPSTGETSQDYVTTLDKLTSAAAKGELSTAMSEFLNGQIYSQSDETSIIMHYIGGYKETLMSVYGLTGKKDLKISTFNLNGAPSRNMTFSNDTGESAIAKLAGRVTTKNLINKTLGSNLDNLTQSLQSKLQGTSVESTVEGLDMKGILDDIFLHNASSETKMYLLGLSGEYDRMIIPRVYNSSTFSPSYHVDIREVCVSTDKFSLLRPFWTIAHLIPYAIPMQTRTGGLFSKQVTTVTPRAPMYAMAYVKGVMNLPRCIISNLTLEFDPKFQTTEGVPTEVNISMDMTSFISLMTTPTLGSLWTAGADAKKGSTDDGVTMMTQMFNPTSSINMIATLCGFNTVFTTPTGTALVKYLTGMCFGKVVRGYRSVKNAYRNLQRGYIQSNVSDALFGTESNMGIGAITNGGIATNLL